MRSFLVVLAFLCGIQSCKIQNSDSQILDENPEVAARKHESVTMKKGPGVCCVCFFGLEDLAEDLLECESQELRYQCHHTKRLVSTKKFDEKYETARLFEKENEMCTEKNFLHVDHSWNQNLKPAIELLKAAVKSGRTNVTFDDSGCGLLSDPAQMSVLVAELKAWALERTDSLGILDITITGSQTLVTYDEKTPLTINLKCANGVVKEFVRAAPCRKLPATCDIPADRLLCSGKNPASTQAMECCFSKTSYTKFAWTKVESGCSLPRCSELAGQSCSKYIERSIRCMTDTGSEDLVCHGEAAENTTDKKYLWTLGYEVPRGSPQGMADGGQNSDGGFGSVFEDPPMDTQGNNSDNDAGNLFMDIHESE